MYTGGKKGKRTVADKQLVPSTVFDPVGELDLFFVLKSVVPPGELDCNSQAAIGSEARREVHNVPYCQSKQAGLANECETTKSLDLATANNILPQLNSQLIPKKARELSPVALATSSTDNSRHSATTAQIAGSAEGTFGFCTSTAREKAGVRGREGVGLL